MGLKGRRKMMDGGICEGIRLRRRRSEVEVAKYGFYIWSRALLNLQAMPQTIKCNAIDKK